MVVVESTLVAARIQHAMLNVAVLLAVFVPSAALGLAIRRARKTKAIRASDPNAPTPNWVALKASGLELAGFGRRLAALAIDVVMVIVVWEILRASLGTGIMHRVLQGIFLVGYYSFGNGFGGAVGARVTRIRLVSADGSRPGVGRGTIRHLMSYISGFLVFGYLSQIWDEDGQTWHDKLAGTYVVRRDVAKSPDATLAARGVGTPGAELQPHATLDVGRMGSAAEPKPQTRPPLPRGEHEPGCTRRHSARQRCTSSADEA